MNKNIALLAAVSVFALTANANALEFRPYVGVQYNYTEVDAENVKPDMNSYSVVVGTEYKRYFSPELPASPCSFPKRQKLFLYQTWYSPSRSQRGMPPSRGQRFQNSDSQRRCPLDK